MSISKNSNITFFYSRSTASFSDAAQLQNDANTLSRTSYFSAATGTFQDNHTRPSIKRKEQLKPTTRLNISHHGNRSQGQNGREQRKEVMQRMMATLSYDSIKPTFGLSKYLGLCGVERGQGSNGCNCFMQPCEWSTKWTKNYNPKNSKLYRSLCSQHYDLKTAEQIEKDLPRTYPDCPTFALNYEFRTKLRNILRIYTIYDMESSYAQGMNMIAGVLLYHIKKEQQTFWAFVDLMDERELRLIYLSGFAKLKERTNRIIQLVSQKMPDLYHLMNQIDVNAEVFLYGWLLSLMSNCVPLQFMHLVIQKFRIDGWNWFYKLIITYLLFLKKALMMCQDCAEFYSQISNTSSKDLGIHWQEILENCHKLDI